MTPPIPYVRGEMQPGEFASPYELERRTRLFAKNISWPCRLLRLFYLQPWHPPHCLQESLNFFGVKSNFESFLKTGLEYFFFMSLLRQSGG
jgi:hypothetical protein